MKFWCKSSATVFCSALLLGMAATAAAQAESAAVARTDIARLVQRAKATEFVKERIIYKQKRETLGRDLWVSREYSSLSSEGILLQRTETDLMTPDEVARNRRFSYIRYSLSVGPDSYTIFPSLKVVIKDPAPEDKMKQFESIISQVRIQLGGDLQKLRASAQKSYDVQETIVDGKAMYCVTEQHSSEYDSIAADLTRSLLTQYKRELKVKHPKYAKQLEKALDTDAAVSTIVSKTCYWIYKDTERIAKIAKYNSVGKLIGSEEVDDYNPDYKSDRPLFELPADSEILFPKSRDERKKMFKKYVKMAYQVEARSAGKRPIKK